MRPSRRAFLGTIGGAAALGAAAGAYRIFGPTVGVSSVIGIHVHVVAPKLPGAPDLSDPGGAPFGADASRVAGRLARETKAAGAEHALCMPRWEIRADDPLGVGPAVKAMPGGPVRRAFSVGVFGGSDGEGDLARSASRVVRPPVGDADSPNETATG